MRTKPTDAELLKPFYAAIGRTDRSGQAECNTCVTPATPSNLESWLSDSRLDAYLGKAAVLKLEILTTILRGDETPLARIAESHGITRAAVSKHARLARKVFGLAT